MPGIRTFWIFGWTCIGHRYYVQMGPEDFVIWRHILGPFCVKIGSQSHDGKYWEAVPLQYR